MLSYSSFSFSSFFFFFLFSTVSAAVNRRVLHQPFIPLDSPPPIPSPPAPATPPAETPATPKYPFDSSTTPNSTNNNNTPFFPFFPSPPPPPSPASFASFPANISSLILPHNSKSKKPVSPKLIATAITCSVVAVVFLSLALFLHLRKRRNNQDSTSSTDAKTQRSENSTRINNYNNNNSSSSSNNINNNIPKLTRPSQTSSEFLYLGNIVSSHGGIEALNAQHCRSGTGTAVNSGPARVSRKLDSPEIRPLPPLHGRSLRQNHQSAHIVSGGGTEDEEEFYSPKGSLGGRESSIGTGSASRRVFTAVEIEMENLGKSSSCSSYSSSSSGSGSPVRSVSLSVSPPASLSPKSSMLKSPELVAIQTAPAANFVPQLIREKESLTSSPSPPSSSSPERYLSRSVDSSPRISNVWEQNVESLVGISSPSLESPLRIISPIMVSPARIIIPAMESPARISTPSMGSPLSTSSPVMESPVRISNHIEHNTPVFVPSPPRAPPPPTRPLSISIPAPPPPPPPPHYKNWESPKTPTPPTSKQAFEPPVLVAPLRPIAFESPVLISPMELPSTSEPIEKIDQNIEGLCIENAEKNEEMPKPKLKTLHWDKVRASSDREMVWDQLKSSSFKLDEEMIETLFVVKTPTPHPKETTRRPVLPSLGQDNRVLDPKKSQNIAILLRAVNVTVEEVCEALLEGNADALGTELLESLLKMAPSKEEERKLIGHKDDSPFKLGPAEKFLKAVLDIPFAFKRIDSMLYISNFESEVDYLRKSFETLEAACEELRSSRMFLKLLEAVLKTGNRMNVGTNRGDAHAFKLDTLLKLVDVKGADGKTTLLHFVVQEIIRSEGARLSGGNQNQQLTVNDDAKCRKLGLQVVSNISSELIDVKKAAAMDSEVLHSDVLKLSKGTRNISEVVQSTDAVGSQDSSIEQFSESMNRFMKMAEEEIIRLQAQESVAMSLVKEITEYFHGDSAREEAHPFRIFMVVRDFLMVLDRVCKEVGMINERTIVSSAHKFPVPVNPTLQPVISESTARRHHSFSDEEESSSP